MREAENTHSCHDHYTFAPSDLLNGKHCNMFIVKSTSVNITSQMTGMKHRFTYKYTLSIYQLFTNKRNEM